MAYAWSSVTGPIAFTNSLERGSNFAVNDAQTVFYFMDATYDHLWAFDGVNPPVDLDFATWFDANYTRPNFENGWVISGIAWFGSHLYFGFNAFNSGLGDDSAYVGRYEPVGQTWGEVLDLEADLGLISSFENLNNQNGGIRVFSDDLMVCVSYGRLPSSNYRLIYSFNGTSWNIETITGVRPFSNNLGKNTGQRRDILVHSIEFIQRVREYSGGAWGALANFPVGQVQSIIGYGHGFTFFSPPSTPGQMLKSSNYGNTVITANGPTYQTFDVNTGGTTICDADALNLVCAVKGQQDVYRWNDITNLWQLDGPVAHPVYALFSMGTTLFAMTYETASLEFYSAPLGFDCSGSVYYGNHIAGLAQTAIADICLNTPDGMDIQFDGDRLFLASFLSGIPEAEMVLYSDPPYTELVDWSDNHETSDPIEAINVINGGFL